MDNSSLTGESEPQTRIPLPNGSKQRPVEAENLVSTLLEPFYNLVMNILQVFNSTLTVNGEGWGGAF